MRLSVRMAGLKRSVCIALLGCFLAFFGRSYYLYHQPLLKKAPVFIVYPGDYLSHVLTKLRSEGWVKPVALFNPAVQFWLPQLPLRVGAYAVTPGMRVSTLFQHMQTGAGVVDYRMTLVEGWTLSEVLSALANSPAVATTEAPEKILATRFHLASLEGMLMPDTYVFHFGNQDLRLLTLAHERLASYLAAQWSGRAEGLRYNQPYDALIVASLIEKETALPEERAIVSGVILNRLKRGMRLQIDAAVRYGLNKPRGVPLTARDLKTPTPYNTYLNAGLPPTPIALSSRAAIRAALHPATHGYYYYVAQGDGAHVFSKTYSAHRLAVRQYRRELARKNKR